MQPDHKPKRIMITKFIINLSIIALIPIFFSSIIMGIIVLEWYFSDTGEFAKIFLTGNFNRSFTVILFTLNIVSISILFWSILIINKYASLIDKFDEATHQLYLAKRKYDAATDKLLNQIEVKE